MFTLKKILSFLAISLISSILYSDSALTVKSFFSGNEIKEAVKGEFLTAVRLTGKGDTSSRGVEIFYPVKSSYINVSSSDYDMFAVEKGFFPMEGNVSNRDRIYRLLTDIPSLKGMRYFSASENRTAGLITESWKITSNEDYIKKDPADNGIPEKSIFHFAVKDNRLGVLTFRSEILSIGENFIVRNISTGTAKKFGMMIFSPGDYRIYKIIIYDRKNKGYFFYNAQFMKVRSSVLNDFDLIKPGSFGNRLRAEDIHFLRGLGIDRSGKLAAFR